MAPTPYSFNSGVYGVSIRPKSWFPNATAPMAFKVGQVGVGSFSEQRDKTAHKEGQDKTALAILIEYFFLVDEKLINTFQ